MFKRKTVLLWLLVCLIAVLGLGACGNGETNDTDRPPNQFGQLLAGQPLETVTVYFADPAGPCLIPLEYKINPTRDTVWVALEKALAGPPNDFVEAILPSGIKIVDVYQDGDYIELFLQGQGELTAEQVDFSAVAATINTAILAQGESNSYPLQVYYNDELLNQEPIEVAPVNDFSGGAAKTATVYYSDSQAMYAVPVEIAVTADDSTELCQAIAEAWLDGPPAESELVGVAPSGSELLSCELKDGLLTLDFDQTLISYQGGTALESMLLNSLLASFGAVDEVQNLQILIEGETVSYLPEGSEIALPLEIPSLIQQNLVQ